VATRASDVLRRVAEARVAVEAAPGAQADEDLRRGLLQCSLQLDGIVAGVEDEQGDTISGGGSSEQFLDLLRGDRVHFLVWTDALHVHGGGPTLAGEVELCDELVGPEQATMG